MDLDWSNLIGVALGGAIAAAAGSVQARSARKSAQGQFAAEMKERRDQEVRVRADARAIEVIDAISALNRLIHGGRSWTYYMSGYLYPSDNVVKQQIDAHISKIGSAATFLPAPLRHQVRIVPELLPRLDEMASQRFLGERPQTAARRILSSAEEAAGRWLRNEPLLEGYSEAIERYRRASQELDDYIDYQVEQDIARAEAQAEEQSD